jgi:acyl dehydratase
MFFEEFTEGQQFLLESFSFSEEEICEFAEKYDPQPIHTDRESASSNYFQGIIASGFQTLITAWIKWMKTTPFGSEVIGGKGMEIKWTAPVRPGDVLSSVVEVVKTIPEPEKKRGEVVCRFTVTNQDGQVVMISQNRALLKSKS